MNDAHGTPRSLPLLELPSHWLTQIAEAVKAQLDDQRRYVTAEGLAISLGTSISAVYDLRERGLPAVRIPNADGRLSKKLYFSLDAVADWMETEGVRV